MARNIADFIFAEAPTLRRRELISAVAHYVAGVLDRETMAATVDGLWQSAQFSPGDRVQTLRGSLHGTITRVLEDGRMAWRSDESGTELVTLPESLSLIEPKS